MRALVTGGAGFIGSNLVERLIAEGAEVWVVDDLTSGALGNLAEARAEAKVHFHRFDIRSDGLRNTMETARPEVVFHLAAQATVPGSVSDPVHDAQINVIGLLNVLQTCVAAGVGKIVFASSGGTIYGPQKRFPVPETATGRPSSPYGITKRVAEDYLRFYRAHHGLDFTSLALANVYGPRQDPHGEAGVVSIFAQKLLHSEAPTIHGTGTDTRDYVYVDDVADAFFKAAQRGSGETVNIGTGVETSTNDLFAVMAEAAGFAGEAVHGPPRPGDVHRSALDPAKAAGTLGWTPWTRLPDGVRAVFDWVSRTVPPDA
jgi:UDP-glucose 4-epimerase